jgi:serine/threonine protein kinase
MIEVGQTIGNYRITAKLGEGGMGVVFLAEHPVIGRKVALKAIHPELSRNPEVVSRFMTEAKSVNQIGNEHIVDVNDFGNTPQGEFYFIMEFLQGESLSDRLRRERVFEPNRALGIAAQVADALAASHEHGIVHRDLKPENIFLINRGQSRDFVKVLDFGLAKLTQGGEKVGHKTRTGSVMGTPYYMAPEQCEGRDNVDQRADIYSLGVILFEMMTGSVPFGGEGYGEIIVKHLTQPPPSPRDLNPMLQPMHEALALRALAKPREARFQTMAAFRAALLDPEGFASEAGPRAPAPAAGPPTPRSGQIPIDTRLMASQLSSTGPRKGPIPSTFRHGVGELIDDDLRPPTSRRGLVVGALVLVAALGGGGFALMRGTTSDVGANAAAPKPDPAVNSAAPQPKTVRIGFSSDPDGAEVFIKASGKKLGTTPFDGDLPFGHAPVAVVFKKAQFEDKIRQIIPEQPGMLDTTLRPLPAPVAATQPSAPPPATDPAKAPAASKPSAKPGSHKTTSPARRRPNAPLPVDEDEVLRPVGL